MYVNESADKNKTNTNDNEIYNQRPDDVTGLHSKELFQMLLEKKLVNTGVTVLYMDLVNFKTINIIFGYSFGNAILKEIADRISKSKFDIASRVGSDEFLIAKDGSATENEDEIYNLVNDIEEPISLCGNIIRMTALIGVSSCEKGADDSVIEVINAAEMAMFEAKRLKMEKVVFFTDVLLAGLKRRALLLDLLRSDRLYDNLYLVVQPEADFKLKKIVAIEALLRLKHDELGIINPLEFIPIAESIGEISNIGNWVIEKSCLFAKSLVDRGIDFGKIAINISPMQLNDSKFISNLMKCLDAIGLGTEYIELEITERLLIEKMDFIADKLSKLKSIGLTIALDDFGTTFSTLNYLINLPIDIIKIDKSFIDGATQDLRKQIILKSLIDLSHKLGYKVVGEGIEDEETKDLLKAMNCDIMQGYYIRHPITLEDVEGYLNQNKTFL